MNEPAEQPGHDPEFSYADAEKLIMSLLHKNPAKVTAVIGDRWLKLRGGVEFEALAQDLVADSWVAFNKSFNPALSRFSTFVYTVASCRLIDRARTASRKFGKEVQASEELPEGESPERFAFGAATIPGIPENLPLRLNRRGASGHRPEAYLAALQLRASRGLSFEKLWVEMVNDPALVAVLGFTRCPSQRSLESAEGRLRRWARREQREKKKQLAGGLAK